jgi:type III secretion system YscD/HrpQ family protein
MAAKLIVEEGPLTGITFLLEDQDEWTMGRDPDLCDLVVEDSSISRKHLHCRRTSTGIVVENLSATNPVEVNEVVLSEPYLLEEGDRIRLGTSLFRYTLEEEAKPLEITQQPPEAEPNYQTIYQPTEDAPAPPLDLAERGRFLLKVVTGPQTGAEFTLEPKRPYLLGTDVATCDVVFHDLSISRQHARITLGEDDSVTIEDLGSRNGVLIDGQPITGPATTTMQNLITLGTTSFVIIDRERASETLISPPLLRPSKPPEPLPSAPLEPQPEPAAAPPPVEEPVSAPPKRSFGEVILTMIVVGAFCIIGIGIWSLLTPKEAVITTAPRDFKAEIQATLADFPDIAFTFNKSTGKLFLLGHVLTQIDKNQLVYNLQALSFVRSVDDNVIIDEFVWQQANALLARQATWRGVAIHAPSPGKFVATGYLKTRAEAADLEDWLLIHFNYLDRLENQVAVEEDLLEKVIVDLIGQQFTGINASLTNGELVIAGYIPIDRGESFDTLVKQWQTMPGIRIIRAFVVRLTPDEAITDLSDKYKVTGSSRQGEEVINVIVNGRIVNVGDTLDGLKITKIDATAIYLEKGGLKYKITYNL